MGRTRVHVSTRLFTQAWNKDIRPVVRRVVRNAKAAGALEAPRGHEIRAHKTEGLYRLHGGFVKPGSGLRGKFRFSNSASYSTTVALGRGPVYARRGGRLRFPNRAGKMILVKRVSAARGNQWMARSLRKAMVKNGLTPRVTHY